MPHDNNASSNHSRKNQKMYNRCVRERDGDETAGWLHFRESLAKKKKGRREKRKASGAKAAVASGATAAGTKEAAASVASQPVGRFDGTQEKAVRLMLSMPGMPSDRQHLLNTSKMCNVANGSHEQQISHEQRIRAGLQKVYEQWDQPPVGNCGFGKFRSTKGGTLGAILTKLDLTQSELAVNDCGLPITLTPPLDYEQILKTTCGKTIISLTLCASQSLLRSRTGTLYVSCESYRSLYQRQSDASRGVVEPLSNILGTLGREQQTARWGVVLVLQIMEVKHLPRDIAKSIIRLLPRPGTVASMIAHPVCTCAICLPIQDIDWEFARDIASGREGWKKWHARHPEVYMPIDYLHMCSDKVVCCNSWTSTNRLFGRA